MFFAIWKVPTQQMMILILVNVIILLFVLFKLELSVGIHSVITHTETLTHLHTTTPQPQPLSHIYTGRHYELPWVDLLLEVFLSGCVLGFISYILYSCGVHIVCYCWFATVRRSFSVQFQILADYLAWFQWTQWQSLFTENVCIALDLYVQYKHVYML